jgi:hypothetical protein
MRTMGRARLCGIVALLAGATPAPAGERARECWADFDAVEGRIHREELVCNDGQRRCDVDDEADGGCTFALRVCAARAAARCKIGEVNRVRLRGAEIAPPPLPTRTEQCGPPAMIRIPNGAQQRLHLTARARGRRGIDRDTLLLRCTAYVCEELCPDNAGGPSTLQLVVAPTGSDLDLGRTGSLHNDAVPSLGSLRLCLRGCDTASDPLCEAKAFTRDCYDEPALLGPPLPLLVAGVPVCMVTRFADGADGLGTANVQSGEIDLRFEVATEVFLTEAEDVCPRCTSGRCTSGRRAGKRCSVDGTVLVPEAATADKIFGVSKHCPPSTDLKAGSLRLPLHLTTATSILSPQPGGTTATPCVAQPGEPPGLLPRADSCPPDGTCTGPCEGDACIGAAVDYATGEPVCRDRKGGLAQRCCSTSRGTPCFPTAPEAGGQLARVGSAQAPAPSWPEPSDLRTTGCEPGRCTVLASTFCLPATGSESSDALWGLPGPGALLMPVTTEWQAASTVALPR